MQHESCGGGGLMHLHSYRLRNYRRLRQVHVELASDISIFVGANNSGKTSATQAVQMFLAGSKELFSIHDFSSRTWRELNEIGDADPAGDDAAALPSIALDLWFTVAEADLRWVIEILPSSDWQGTQVGVRIEFCAREPLGLLQRFRKVRAEAQQNAAALPGGAGSYRPWPKTLTDYLGKELATEFDFRYFVLDRAQFSDAFVAHEGYSPAPFAGGAKGAAYLRSLVRVNCLNAQRHLDDPDSNNKGSSSRSEDLSRRLSRFYQRNLKQRREDQSVLKALFESEEGLNKHLAVVFESTLNSIAALGYPGLNNPKLEIKSALNPASIMRQDARVHYVLGEGQEAPRLPDSYSGLGFKNLIYIVVEILDLHAKWIVDAEERALLNLIFIEEPEAHLHAQLQQVFIRNVLALVKESDTSDNPFASQIVITTHSPHILYERGFTPIRYFRRHITDGEQTTQVLNLSRFQADPEPKDRDFLQRYLKLTHCDLFFADAAILVEGNVERLLLPVMIEKEAKRLRSSSLCILEVGGAFGHRFKELLEFLEITTLIITDIDSVTRANAPANDESEEKEFEVPGDAPEDPPIPSYGKVCPVSEPTAVTANQTLIKWLPRKLTIAELLAATSAEKEELLTGSEIAKVRVAYEVPIQVTWNGVAARVTGRTIEEAFGLENAAWCQAPARRHLGLRLKTTPNDHTALALGLHRKVIGRNFDKTKFALGVLAEQDGWQVPLYIKEGLDWLQDKVSLEAEMEDAAAPVATQSLTVSTPTQATLPPAAAASEEHVATPPLTGPAPLTPPPPPTAPSRSPTTLPSPAAPSLAAPAPTITGREEPSPASQSTPATPNLAAPTPATVTPTEPGTTTPTQLKLFPLDPKR